MRVCWQQCQCTASLSRLGEGGWRAGREWEVDGTARWRPRRRPRGVDEAGMRGGSEVGGAARQRPHRWPRAVDKAGDDRVDGLGLGLEL